MRAALAPVLLTLCSQSGCMAYDRRIEHAPGPPRLERGAPLAGSERVYALIVPRMDLLELRVRAEALCTQRSVRSVERTEVVTSRAAGHRFIGAAAAVVGGTILLSGKGSDVLGAGLIGTGGAIVVLPMLSADQERRRLPREQWAEPATARACADRPVHDAHVAVRIGSRILEGKSDVAGRVRFRDEKASEELAVFVDDVAVPVSIGAPPTAALPTDSADRPDEP